MAKRTRRPIPYAITRNARNDYHIEIWSGAAEAGEPGTGYMVTLDATQWHYAACLITACQRGDLRQYVADLRSASSAVAGLSL